MIHGRKQKALSALSAIQTDSGVVVPDNVVIDLLEAARSGTADYSTLCARMDASISKIVLSQTMTTDDGSSLSQAQVHEGVKDQVVKADADMLCESFNQQVVTWLTAWNFPTANPRLEYGATPNQRKTLRQEPSGTTRYPSSAMSPPRSTSSTPTGKAGRKKETSPLPPVGPGAPALPAEFQEISKLTQTPCGLKGGSAKPCGCRPVPVHQIQRDLYGKRVEQLLSYMEETDDLETFREKLTEMMEDIPAEESVETIQRATLFGRLMGLFRAQRT